MTKSFAAQIDDELTMIKGDVNRVMSDTIVEGLATITSRAAVDTGRYRASWNISKNAPDNSVRREKRKPKGHKRGQDLYGFKQRARILFNIAKDKSVILSNNVEYAKYVDALYGDVMKAKEVMKAGLVRRLKAMK